MKRLLIVEDLPKDVKRAAAVAESAGFDEVKFGMSLGEAQTILEKGLASDGLLPDVIVLDLNLGNDSGFELLRFWRTTPRLALISVIIWSIFGDEKKELCALFKVNSVVAKREGDQVLREALLRLSRPAPETHDGL